MTLEEAFSGPGLLFQLPFLLIIIALGSGRFDRARVITAIAGLIGLASAVLMRGEVVLAVWWGLIMVASLMLIAKRLLERATVRFTEEEEVMRRGLLSDLPRSRARHLLDQGFWLSGREGDTLTRQGEPVSHLYYISAGEARVISNGKAVGMCREGDLIGEVTLMSGDNASATVMLAGPARFWCSPANVLRPYVQTHDDVRRALEQGFSKALRAKLKASNDRIAERGEVATAS